MPVAPMHYVEKLKTNAQGLIKAWCGVTNRDGGWFRVTIKPENVTCERCNELLNRKEKPNA